MGWEKEIQIHNTEITRLLHSKLITLVKFVLREGNANGYL